MDFRRRAVLRMGLAGPLLMVSNPGRAALGTQVVGCRISRSGRYLLSCVDASTGIDMWNLALPGRGHDVVQRPGSHECAVFARRPQEFMGIVDLGTGQWRTHVSSAPGRHFFGHGVYSADGCRLYTTENAYDRAYGVVGVYDADHGYRRIGEFNSHGTGPHEILLMPDGAMLAIANGGIQTHPDFGREKLNLDTMRPNLALIDAQSGTLESLCEPPTHLHQLSIRHIAVNDDAQLCIAMQYQGRTDRYPPLVAFSDQGRFELVEAPESIHREMHNYCASVEWVPSYQRFAITSPHKGLLSFWSPTTGYVDSIQLSMESSALCVSHSDDALWVTGVDRLQRINVSGVGISSNSSTPGSALWDNHMISVQ